MIYLDNASTTKINDEVLSTYETLLKTYFGNSSGNHKMAREVNRLQDKARTEILKSFNYTNGNVIFTTGATEANNLALIGLFLQYKNRGNEIIISAFEHPSIRKVVDYLAAFHGAIIKEVPLLGNGELDLAFFEKALSSKTVLVSIMAVNNEIGTITNITAIRKLLKLYPKLIFHSDVTQAVGKVTLDYELLDAFSFSAHKIHGLKGSGALIIRDKLVLTPLMYGGAQEGGFRPGTSNSPTNIVLAKTVRLAFINQLKHFQAVEKVAYQLYTLLEKESSHFIINSKLTNPYIINFSLINFRASVLLNGLDNADIMIGTTSSCSAKIDEPSMSVMALTNSVELATNALRISFSHENTINEVNELMRTMLNIIKGKIHE